MANPNPSPETRFTSSGNPAGKTAKQRQDEVQAAEIAAALRLAALIRMQESVASGEIDPMELVTSDNLRLMKDSEDRAHGTPRQTVAGAGENGEHLHKVSADEAFARFADRLGSVTPGTEVSTDIPE